jgi:hypothetical protein
MTRQRKAISAKAGSKKKPRAVAKRPARKIVKTVQRLDWQGIIISVAYEADWLGLATKFGDVSNAHLEIEAVTPGRAVLPITDTGYRSQFLSRTLIEQAGGPVAYAKAWLDEAAKAPAWKRREETSRQLSLF